MSKNYLVKTLDDWHVHEIHRTYLWSSYSDAQYDMPSGVYAQHSAYYPFGRVEYTQDFGEVVYLSTLASSLQNNWDGNHVKLGIANCYHTLDIDLSGTNCGDYSLLPLTDDVLITAYRLELDDESGSNCCPLCGVEAFKYDISDPFDRVFWEDHYHRDHDFPTISATINSAEADMSNGTLVVNVSAYYDNRGA